MVNSGLSSFWLFNIHSFIHSFFLSFVRSFINSLIHSFIHSFIRSFVHSFIHSFVHSFILETYIAPPQDTTTQRRSLPQGRPSPLRQWCISPLNTFFSFPTYLRCFSTFPHISRKLLLPPTFPNAPPWFHKIYVFFAYKLCTLCVFRFPLVWPWCI